MVSAVPALVVASAASAIAGWPSPLEATAEQLMEWTPVDLANYLLLHIGPASRPAALLGALAIAMLAGGIAGAVAAVPRTGRIGRLAGLTVACIFMLAVFLLFLTPSVDAPELWFVGAFALTLPLFSHSISERPGRRETLLRSGTILGGAAILLTLFSVRPLLRALAVRRLIPYRRPSGFAVAGLTDLVTPTERFYIMDKVLQYPEVGPPGWRLIIDGAVIHARVLDYGNLLARLHQNRYVTLECVDNPVGGSLMGTALWTGIPLSDLLDEVGAQGDTVVFHSADQYSESVPTAQIAASRALLVVGMNGEVLPREHGFPVRIVLPGVYGFKSVKWLQRIEVVRGQYAGDWRSHGWTTTARIHTTARIDVARRTGSDVLLAGVAFAGDRGVRVVEVRANGGPWHRATLGRKLSDDTWVQWGLRLQGPPGAIFEVRAIDGHGVVQEERRHDAYPNGATGWHSITV